jgi:hypothetical protein
VRGKSVADVRLQLGEAIRSMTTLDDGQRELFKSSLVQSKRCSADEVEKLTDQQLKLAYADLVSQPGQGCSEFELGILSKLARCHVLVARVSNCGAQHTLTDFTHADLRELPDLECVILVESEGAISQAQSLSDNSMPHQHYDLLWLPSPNDCPRCTTDGKSCDFHAPSLAKPLNDDEQPQVLRACHVCPLRARVP